MPRCRNRQGLPHPGSPVCLDLAPRRKQVGRSGSRATRWVEVQARLHGEAFLHPVSGGPAPVRPQSAVAARPSLQTAGAVDPRDPPAPSETVRPATRAQFLTLRRPEMWRVGRAALCPNVCSLEDAPDPVFALDHRLSLQMHPGGGMRHEPNRPPGSPLPADPLFLPEPEYSGRILRGWILPAWVLFLPETSLLRDARRTSADGAVALR